MSPAAPQAPSCRLHKLVFKRCGERKRCMQLPLQLASAAKGGGKHLSSLLSLAGQAKGSSKIPERHAPHRSCKTRRTQSGEHVALRTGATASSPCEALELVLYRNVFSISTSRAWPRAWDWVHFRSGRSAAQTPGGGGPGAWAPCFPAPPALVQLATMTASWKHRRRHARGQAVPPA